MDITKIKETANKIKESEIYARHGKNFMVMSLLSDAQENITMMTGSSSEQRVKREKDANFLINVAKVLLSEEE